MLSNNRLCLRIAAALYVLLFLVLAVNSDQCQILPRKLHSLTLATTLGTCIYVCLSTASCLRVYIYIYSLFSAALELSVSLIPRPPTALELSVSPIPRPHSLDHEANRSGDPSQISLAI